MRKIPDSSRGFRGFFCALHEQLLPIQRVLRAFGSQCTIIRQPSNQRGMETLCRRAFLGASPLLFVLSFLPGKISFIKVIFCKNDRNFFYGRRNWCIKKAPQKILRGFFNFNRDNSSGFCCGWCVSTGVWPFP